METHALKPSVASARFATKTVTRNGMHSRACTGWYGRLEPLFLRMNYTNTLSNGLTQGGCLHACLHAAYMLFLRCM